jgi:antitoxin ParD1/3/4
MASIPVSTDVADRIRDLIASGAFSSEGDVVDAALNALDREEANREDDLAWVKAKIRASVEDTRPGYTIEEVSEHLRDLFERAQKRHDSAA